MKLPIILLVVFTFGLWRIIPLALAEPTPSITSTPILAPTPTLTLTPTPSPTLTPAPTFTLTPTPQIYTSLIFLNEFLPNPETGGKEWVELYNAGNTQVDLSGWKIDDIEGGSSPQTIESSTVIGSKSYWVIYFLSATGKVTAKLNNEGDTVRLLDPTGAVHDAFSYGSSIKGWSWAKKADGSWQETSAPTPGGANQFVVPTPTPTPKEDSEEEGENANLTPTPNKSYKSYTTYTLAEAKQQKLGALVSVEGIITAPPELLGDKTLFIQQDEAGIKIKLADLDYSQLNLGDKVKVSGELKESFQEKYLKDSGQTVTFLAKGGEPVADKMETGKVGEDWEGRLVEVNGEVMETSGSTFHLDDGTGQIKIYIKSTTEIEKPKMKKGYFAKVTGIVSQYKEDYRILPRFQEDLLVSDQPIADEREFEGESWIDPSEVDSQPADETDEQGEVLAATTSSSDSPTELPATGVDLVILVDPILAFGLLVLNLLARRKLTA